MKIQAVLRTMTVIAGVLATIGLTSIALAQGASPLDRVQRPAAVIDLYVDRNDDLNVTTCAAANNDCTLRGAINKANVNPANIYTIYFTPAVTNVLLASPLPTITANLLWVLGDRGVPRVDAAGMSLGNPFLIQANDVRLSGLSIVNGRSLSDGAFADIRVISGTRLWIDSNYLGTVPPTTTLTSCTSSGVTRNSAYGILVFNAVTGTIATGAGSVYIYNNTIGCHGVVGVVLAGSDYARIGLNPLEERSGNFIGVNAQGLTLTNALDGVAVASFGADGARLNRVGYNIIGGNGRHGISVVGNGTADANGTTSNAIVGNSIGMLADNTPRGNAQHGIELMTRAFHNSIDGNVIGANGLNGIQANDAPNTFIDGNVIGTDLSATLDRGNGGSGIVLKGTGSVSPALSAGASENLIGFNALDGIQLDNASSYTLTANFIGTLPLSAGRLRLFPNGRHGVHFLNGAQHNLQGQNAIGFNRGDGVRLDGSSTANNTFRRDLVYQNAGHGISLQNGAHDNELGGAYGLAIYSNTLNGLHLAGGAYRNTVSGGGIYSNTGSGVLLEDEGTRFNVISGTAIFANGYDGVAERSGAKINGWLQMSIYNNGGLGIDRNAITDTLNAIDPPTATITSVIQADSAITLGGTGPDGATVDVYRVALDPSGYGEGKTFVGRAAVASGQWSLVTSGSSIGCYTLVETILNVGSSEFSANTCRLFLPTVLK